MLVKTSTIVALTSLLAVNAKGPDPRPISPSGMDDASSSMSTDTSTDAFPTDIVTPGPPIWTGTRGPTTTASTDSSMSTGGPKDSGGHKNKKGDLTFYDVTMGTTACGHEKKGSDYIVAVSHELFDNYPGHTENPNNNPICGKHILIELNGKQVNATIEDKCASCDGRYDIDGSYAVYDAVADRDKGRVHNVPWHYIDELLPPGGRGPSPGSGKHSDIHSTKPHIWGPIVTGSDIADDDDDMGSSSETAASSSSSEAASSSETASASHGHIKMARRNHPRNFRR